MKIAGQAAIIPKKNTQMNPNKSATVNPSYRYNILTPAAPAIQRRE
jgi:hypothetical protein